MAETDEQQVAEIMRLRGVEEHTAWQMLDSERGKPDAFSDVIPPVEEPEDLKRRYNGRGA